LVKSSIGSQSVGNWEGIWRYFEDFVFPHTKPGKAQFAGINRAVKTKKRKFGAFSLLLNN
jgi:hypothetical protein